MANSDDKFIYRFNRSTTTVNPYSIFDANRNNINKNISTLSVPADESSANEPICSDLCTTVLPIVAILIFLCVVGKCMMTFCMPNWLRLRRRHNPQIFNEQYDYHYSRRGTRGELAPQRCNVSIISELSNSLSGEMDSHQMTTNSSRQLDNDLIQQYLRCSYGEIFLQAMPPSYDEAQKEEELQHCSAASTIASTANNSGLTNDGDSRNIYNIWRQNYNSRESLALSPDITDYYRSSARANSISANPIGRELEGHLTGNDRPLETHRFRIMTGSGSIPAPPDDFDDELCRPPPSYPNSARPSLAAGARDSVVSALVPLRRLSLANPRTSISAVHRTSISSMITEDFQEGPDTPTFLRQNSATSSNCSTANDRDITLRAVYDAPQAEIELLAERSRQFSNTEDMSWRPTCHTILEESACHVGETDSMNDSKEKCAEKES